MTIVDSCIVFDITEGGARTASATRALKQRLRVGKLYAPDVVFAEVCYGYDSVEVVEAIFQGLQIEVRSPSNASLFRASKAFEAFAKRNKTLPENERVARRILPDFFVGAIAEEEGLALLTRDTKRRWSTYFPALVVIEP